MTFNPGDFIDTHTHILPGIDDGPKDIEESLEIARCYSQAGVEKIVATPHFIPGTAWSASKESVLASVTKLQSSLEEAGIDLEILPGMEIAFHKNLESRLQDNSLLPLGNSSYFMIEPFFHGEQDSLLTSLSALLENGFNLILAHPERIEELRPKFHVIEKLVAKGLYIQVNTGSLLGHFGRSSMAAAEQLHKMGCLHILASDAHDSVKRHPLTKEQFCILLSQSGVRDMLYKSNETLCRLFTSD